MISMISIRIVCVNTRYGLTSSAFLSTVDLIPTEFNFICFLHAVWYITWIRFDLTLGTILLSQEP